MSDQVKKYFCPRLIDYVIFVGPKEVSSSGAARDTNLEQQQQQQQQQHQQPPQQQPPDRHNNRVPHLLRCYPPQAHADFPLPPDVVIFCQPEGCDHVKSSLNAYNNPSQTTNSFVFLLTEKDTSRIRYGVCLNFYRPIQKCPPVGGGSGGGGVRNSNSRRKQHQSTRAHRPLDVITSSCGRQQEAGHATAGQTTSCNQDDKCSQSTLESGIKLSTGPDSDSAGSATGGGAGGRAQAGASGGHRHQHRHKAQQQRARGHLERVNTTKERFRVTYALNSICIISHHPFFSTFRECLFIMKKYIQACEERHSGSSYFGSSSTVGLPPKCRCHLRLRGAAAGGVRSQSRRFNQQATAGKSQQQQHAQQHPQQQQQQQQWPMAPNCHHFACPYANPIWSLLTMSNIDAQTIPRPMLGDVGEIEAWLLRLLSVPVPVPGKTKIELEIMPASLKPPLMFALPDHTRLSLIDFPLHLPLELLGVETCLQVLTCILLEHKVALQSKDYNALSMSVMAFVTMIYPLEYMFPVIPLLPSYMSSAEQLLLAPTPYIIGFPSSFFKFRHQFTLPNDVWIVDLDANKVKRPPNVEELPPLPEYEGRVLVQNLQRILDSMSQHQHQQQQQPENSVRNSPESQAHGANQGDSSLPQISLSSEGGSGRASARSSQQSQRGPLVASPRFNSNSPQAGQAAPTSSVPSSPFKTRRSSVAAAGQLLQFAANKLSGGASGSDRFQSSGPANGAFRGASPQSSNRSSFALAAGVPGAASQTSRFNPLAVLGGPNANDLDSVDVAVRVAMVSFFNSQEVLANFVEHTRTIRLYPRPVVSFQKSSFVQSRAKLSPFLLKLVDTQSVEYLAEWALCPDNVAFQRIQTGVYDPAIIGDKPKWYEAQLELLRYQICDSGEFYEEIVSLIKDSSGLSAGSGPASSVSRFSRFSHFYDDEQLAVDENNNNNNAPTSGGLAQANASANSNTIVAANSNQRDNASESSYVSSNVPTPPGEQGGVAAGRSASAAAAAAAERPLSLSDVLERQLRRASLSSAEQQSEAGADEDSNERDSQADDSSLASSLAVSEEDAESTGGGASSDGGAASSPTSSSSSSSSSGDSSSNGSWEGDTRIMHTIPANYQHDIECYPPLRCQLERHYKPCNRLIGSLHEARKWLAEGEAPAALVLDTSVAAASAAAASSVAKQRERELDVSTSLAAAAASAGASATKRASRDDTSTTTTNTTNTGDRKSSCDSSLTEENDDEQEARLKAVPDSSSCDDDDEEDGDVSGGTEEFAFDSIRPVAPEELTAAVVAVGGVVPPESLPLEEAARPLGTGGELPSSFGDDSDTIVAANSGQLDENNNSGSGSGAHDPHASHAEHAATPAAAATVVRARPHAEHGNQRTLDDIASFDEASSSARDAAAPSDQANQIDTALESPQPPPLRQPPTPTPAHAPTQGAESVSTLLMGQKARVSNGVAKLLDRASSLETKFLKQQNSTGSAGGGGGGSTGSASGQSPLPRGEQMSAFFDRFTSEARDAVKEARAALDAGKQVLKTTAIPVAETGRQKLLKNLQNLGENLLEDRRDSVSSAAVGVSGSGIGATSAQTLRDDPAALSAAGASASSASAAHEQVQAQQQAHTPQRHQSSDSSSDFNQTMSTTDQQQQQQRNSQAAAAAAAKGSGSDFNEFAGRANSMISGWLGSKATALSNRMRDRTRPFGPFPSIAENNACEPPSTKSPIEPRPPPPPPPPETDEPSPRPARVPPPTPSTTSQMLPRRASLIDVRRSSLAACGQLLGGMAKPRLGMLRKSALNQTIDETRETNGFNHDPLQLPPTDNGESEFFVGQKLVQKTRLIRHSTALSETIDQKPAPIRGAALAGGQSDGDNQQFLKEVVSLVMRGEGVGWLKLSRMKKLMEDESYRNLVLAQISKNLESRVRPDDRISDVRVSRPVWRGMLKVCQSVVSGLEQSYMHNKLVGMASVFALLEVAHTHYWTREASEPGAEPSGGASSSVGPANASANSGQASASTGSVDDLSEIDKLKSNAGSRGDESRRSSQSDRDREQQQQQQQRDCGAGSELPPETLTATTSGDFSSSSLDPSRSQQGLITSGTANPDNPNDMQYTFKQMWDIERGLPQINKATLASGVTLNSLSDDPRVYLYEGLVLAKDRSSLWDQIQFWEEAFLDAVSHERCLVGMDQGPDEMLERYKLLYEVDKKRLEHEEDRLLSTLLYNMVAFMVMLQVDQHHIKQKIRRLLGKCHIGLVNSAEINQLLERIESLKGNDIDLKPMASRQQRRQTFTLHNGTDTSGEIVFMEVRDDGLVLRGLDGVIIERWWYERLVNMTCNPRDKVVCFWRYSNRQTILNKYHTKKCRELYQCIKESMQRAATHHGTTRVCPELGGEFPVLDMKSGAGGILQVCMEGVGLLFATSKYFIRLENIRKCFTQKGGTFILEEYNPKTRQLVQNHFKSQMADQICYAILCVFSYVAAGQNKAKATLARDPETANARH